MLLFDLDGTITDTNGLWLEVDRDFLARRGLESTDEYREYIAHCIFETAAPYTKEMFSLPESVDEIKHEWLELAAEHYAHAELKKGAAEYITRARAQGARLAIVTSCMAPLCETALKKHGLYDCFEFFVYANDLGVEKRHPDAYLHAASTARVPPAECTMFEDSPISAAGAKQAGMYVIGVSDRYYAPRAAQMQAICDEYHTDFTTVPFRA